jgi:hypothetical protein
MAGPSSLEDSQWAGEIGALGRILANSGAILIGAIDLIGCATISAPGLLAETSPEPPTP